MFPGTTGCPPKEPAQIWDKFTTIAMPRRAPRSCRAEQFDACFVSMRRSDSLLRLSEEPKGMDSARLPFREWRLAAGLIAAADLFHVLPDIRILWIVLQRLTIEPAWIVLVVLILIPECSV